MKEAEFRLAAGLYSRILRDGEKAQSLVAGPTSPCFLDSTPQGKGLLDQHLDSPEHSETLMLALSGHAIPAAEVFSPHGELFRSNNNDTERKSRVGCEWDDGAKQRQQVEFPRLLKGI